MAALAPPWFVVGGFAEEALHWQRLTRPHADLDVLTVRARLSQCLRQLPSLGRPEVDAGLEARPGRPMLFGDRDGLRLEI